MSPKCVYGEHEARYGERLGAPGNGMPCEPEPTTKLTEADFASLLEMEPLEMGDAGMLADVTRQRDNHRKTSDSQAARIKSLENVLVAIRAKVTKPIAYDQKAILAIANEIIVLINETLDPCKPWCVQEPGHQGTCAAVDDSDLEG